MSLLFFSHQTNSPKCCSFSSMPCRWKREDKAGRDGEVKKSPTWAGFDLFSLVLLGQMRDLSLAAAGVQALLCCLALFLSLDFSLFCLSPSCFSPCYSLLLTVFCVHSLSLSLPLIVSLSLLTVPIAAFFPPGSPVWYSSCAAWRQDGLEPGQAAQTTRIFRAASQSLPQCHFPIYKYAHGDSAKMQAGK